MVPPSRLPPRLAALHRWVRAQGALRRFTLANRVLLAMAFLPTGLVKVTGQRFTLLGVDTPVGFFFEAMYRTGPYWIFIGAVQVAAATLLLIPHTALLGALTFLPVSVSIFLITWGVGFGNTVWVTAAMSLSALYLVCWDADRVWAAGAALARPEADLAPLLADAGWIERAGWVVGALSGMGFFLLTRGFVPTSWVRPLLLLGAGAALLVTGSWIHGWLRGRSAAIAPPSMRG